MAKYKWPEGSDITLRFNYKEGVDAEHANIVNLTSDYAVRMDLVLPGTRTVVYTFNSDDIPDALPLVPGDQPEAAPYEISLGDGQGGLGNIAITLGRPLVLPGGEVWAVANDEDNPNPILEFDIFLRNISTNKQGPPIHSGSIQVVPSKTLWV